MSLDQEVTNNAAGETFNAKRSGVVPAVRALLAVAAGAIHLAHNYLPMKAWQPCTRGTRWAARTRSAPARWALVVELALILIALGDVVFLAISRVWSAECVTGSV